LPLILDKINLKITRGERIGIVGRTGAGKTSLFLALEKILETCEGRLIINCQEIKNLSYFKMRSYISVIP